MRGTSEKICRSNKYLDLAADECDLGSSYARRGERSEAFKCLDVARLFMDSARRKREFENHNNDRD